MHLRVLKENEKKAMIDLAFYLFNLDGEFSEHEKNFINLFTHTTMLDLIQFIPQKKSLHQILLHFKDSSSIVKKAIFYEIVVLAYNDHVPTDKELKLLETLKSEWNIDDIIAKEANKTALDLMNIQKKGIKILEN